MSLAELVAESAEQIEQLANEFYEQGHHEKKFNGDLVAVVDDFIREIKSIARDLRVAAKVSASAPNRNGTSVLDKFPVVDPDMERELRRVERQTRHEEMLAANGDAFGTSMICVEGGDADGSYVPFSASAPEGAFTKVGDTVYQWIRGKLVYSEKQTFMLRQTSNR